MKYIIVSVIALIFSFIFSIAGIGSSTAMVPVIIASGFSFNVAKATALFINIFSMSSATAKNLKEGKLNTNAVPMAFAALIASPLGAYSTIFIPEIYVKLLFAIFLIYSATSIIFLKTKNDGKSSEMIVMVAIGAISGFLGGMLGIGGGVIALSIFFILGYNAKDIVSFTSLMVLASSITGFIAYYSLSHVDLLLLIYLVPFSLAGGWIGTHICFKINERVSRAVVSLILYFLSIKMFLCFI